MAISLNGCALLSLEPGGGLQGDEAGAWREADQAAKEAREKERLARERAVHYGRQNRDVVLGMEMRDVASVWGEPTDVELAGNPEHGNERWIYATGLSSRWSLRTARVVYFEGGRVTGWETR